MSRFFVALGLLFSALAPALSANPAHACTCVPPRPKRVVEFADAIIVGTVDQVKPPAPGPGGMMASLDQATVWATAERYLKGSGGPQLQFATAKSGASCGALEVLRVGECHVLFLKGGEGGYTTDLCAGNAPLGGMTLDGVGGQTFLGQVEAITGPGTTPTGHEESISRQGVGLSAAMAWGLAIAGVAGAVALAMAAALVARRTLWR